MEKRSLESKVNIPKIESHEFIPINKKIRIESGLVVGVVSKTTGIWVLVRQENGETEVKRLSEVVGATDPAWKKIEKLAIKPSTQRTENIRPPGRYSYLDRKNGNM